MTQFLVSLSTNCMRDTLIITAEQVASLKALEQIQNLRLAEDAEQTVVANTDSKVTLDTLRNGNKHYILIGNIRKEIKMLGTNNGQCFLTG